MLTGATDKRKRKEMVESFNKDATSVFCISLKAGGTGLNLTAADIVIHYDPWWNEAVQNQATDRAHRIGQQNVVNVYRLISKGTIEEKIVKLQEQKKALADQILSGDGFSQSNFSKEELLELLGGEE
jgi:SNF2 family DNA or RNA helicase